MGWADRLGSQTQPADRGAPVEDPPVDDRPGERVLRNQLEETALLLDVVGHDVLAGVTSISGFTELLETVEGSTWTDDDRRRALSRIASNARRIKHIVTNVVDMTQADAGAIRPRRSRTNVADLLACVLEDLDLAGHPVDVFVERLYVNVDSFMLSRIVENLVLNAVRHTPSGTHVTLVVAPVSSGVLLTVADDGPGIPPAVRKVIFDRRKLTQRNGHRAAGLGLSIVKRFSSLHGGDAWIADARVGTMFHVVVSTVDGVRLRRPRRPRPRPDSSRVAEAG